MILVVILIISAAIVWPAARICSRIGLSPWLGFAAIVPVVNVALLWFVALSRWPGDRH